MNYGMRKDRPITAGKKDTVYKGTRSPYAQITKKKGGSIGSKSKCSHNRLY